MTAKRALVPSPAWAWFFDIDGTLLQIARTPRDVRVDQQLRRLIRRLHASSDGAVALISGRGIEDIDRLFPGLQLPVAGQHGVEHRDSTGRIRRHRFPMARLREVHRQLVPVVARHSGLLLEDKGSSLALHYRKAPRLAGYAHRLMRSASLRLGDAFCVQAGKRVVEIRPSGKDKGTAIAQFMRGQPFRGRTPVFVGDDATDEFGFTMINRLRGYSVKVGRGGTRARWRLPSVAAVRGWLEIGRPLPVSTQ